ncbi:MAG: S-adenosylmethionine decarboxylase [Thermodesulfobacteriota bacterium]
MDYFGQHLMVDGYGGNSKKMENIELIYNFLDTYPEKMEMTKIMPPYVFKYIGKKPEDWGLSGVVLIAESHISIHTFPFKQYLSLDIFSCKTFDSDNAICFVKDMFGLTKTEIKLLNRGLEFPRDICLATDIVYRERLNMVG